MDAKQDTRKVADREPIEQPMVSRRHRQIKVSEPEKQRMISHIWNFFHGARSNHDTRIERFRRLWRMWRSLNVTRGDDEEGEDFQVPMMKWTLLGQWARVYQAIMGDDAKIRAQETAPSDAANARKVGHYMTWRVFEYMRSAKPIATWVFRALLFGRGIAMCPYEQEYYKQRDKIENVDLDKLDAADLRYQVNKDGTVDYEVLAYDGPKLVSLWPSEFITPAQDNVNHLDDFAEFIHRFRMTPDQLLEGEAKGRFQGINENWDKIVGAAAVKQERDWFWDDEKNDLDEAEGVNRNSMLGNRDSVEVWAWYGDWRLPKGGRDTREENLKYRQEWKSELLIYFLPRVGIIVGVEDRRTLWPRMKKRNPFIDIGLTKDGSFWCPGIGEYVEELQNEATINHALFRRAGQFSVGPLIFFDPASGLKLDTKGYEPFEAIATKDPRSVNVVSFPFNPEYSSQMNSMIKGMVELVTGVSDSTAGISSDRPNAPRTASGQAMLLQEGNTRASLDMAMIREDLNDWLDYVWLLDREYADPETFFRATDDEAVGMYDADAGFSKLTAQEREVQYGFKLKFATSIWQREAMKQSMISLYQLTLQNPLVAQNARAMWVLLNRLWEAFGEDNFKDVIPEPPMPDHTKTPKEEWILMTKGEEVDVNPADDDVQHLTDHRRRLELEMNKPLERQDANLQKLDVEHIMAHEHQRRQKMMLMAMAQKLMQDAQASGQMPLGMQPGQMQPGGPPQPGQQPGQPMGQPQQQLAPPQPQPPSGMPVQ